MPTVEDLPPLMPGNRYNSSQPPGLASKRCTHVMESGAQCPGSVTGRWVAADNSSMHSCVIRQTLPALNSAAAFHCCRSLRCNECKRQVPGATQKKGKLQQMQEKKAAFLQKNPFYAGSGDKPAGVTVKAAQNYRVTMAAITSSKPVSTKAIQLGDARCILV